MEQFRVAGREPKTARGVPPKAGKSKHCRMNTKRPRNIPPAMPEDDALTAAKGSWRWTFVVAVVMLVGIVSYLLWHSYQTQSRLQTAAMNRLTEDLHGRSKAADYFIRERENDVSELATGNIVIAYFTNKSLGMSEAYGLKGSMNLIHRQFRHLNESAMLDGQAVYTRLVLFSSKGEQLVEYQGVSPCPIRQWDWQAVQNAAVQQTTALLDRVNPSYLIFTTPVHLAGEIVGYIAGWVSLNVVYHQFIALEQASPGYLSGAIVGTTILTRGAEWQAMPPIDTRLLQSLKRELARGQVPENRSSAGRIHQGGGHGRPGTHFLLSGGSGRKNNLFVAATRLSLNDIHLVRIIEQTHLVDPHASIRMLVMLALISATVVGIAFVALRHGTKAQVLAGRLAESQRRQMEIRRINEQLNDEILQRKMAESQIISEKNLLRNLISAIPDLVYYKDVDSAYLGCNPSFEAFCAQKEPSILHKTVFDLFDKELAAAFFDQDKEVLGKGATMQFEQWVDYPNGRRILLETKKTPYYSETGQVLGLIGVSRDITARKQTELALNEQRERLELVIHATNTGVWEWNVETGATIFNERWAAIVGYTLAELSPVNIQTWLDLCHPDDLERSNQALERHFSNETDFYDCECRMRHKQGHWVWVHDCGQVVQWTSDNKPLRMLGTHSDITDRKQAEENLRNSVERFRDLVDMLPEAIFETDMDLRISFANQRAFELSGYDEADLQAGINGLDLITPADRDRVGAFTADRFQGRDLGPVEYQVLRKDGSSFPGLFHARAIVKHGKISGLRGIIIDITQRKLAEEALRDANENLEYRIQKRTAEIQQIHGQMVMQEKMASVGQLAAGIAHELNNPINFVRTNFATLTENFTDLTEVLRDYRGLVDSYDARYDTATKIAGIRAKEQSLQIDYLLEDIPALFSESQRGFERIARIIQSMRDFSHVDHTGSLTYFNINKGIKDTLVIAKNVYKYHAEVRTNLGNLPEIQCLPEQINQVLLNLVVNSAQAIAEKPEGGQGLIAIKTWHEGNHVCCQITDNGPGIPAAARSRIFEPFFTTKAPGKGTGLGLSISYDIIVHKHQGKLEVDSPEAGGTVFTLRLPVEAQPKVRIDEVSQ